MLISTAVIGATTMIFSIILLLQKRMPNFSLDLLEPRVLLGLLMGGATIYWFTGASIQAVTTGAYRAVEFIKKNIRLDRDSASIEDSKTVVKICTQYAQAGMFNIFVVIFCTTLAYAFFDPVFFVAYLISIAMFSLYQAMFLASTSSAWTTPEVVKSSCGEEHALHDDGHQRRSTIRSRHAFALNPIIKFTTLFGVLVRLSVAIRA